MRVASLAVLLLATTASADVGSDVAPATTADKAFAKSVAAYLGGLSEVCDETCSQQVVASGKVGASRVELRKTATGNGDVYAVVVGQGKTWSAQPPIGIFNGQDCAMGECHVETIAKTTVTEVDGIAWMTMTVHARVDNFHDGHAGTVERDHQIAIGCESSRCMIVKAGTYAQDGSLTIGSDGIEVREGGKRRTVAITLGSS
jgi:hypothetical protein